MAPPSSCGQWEPRKALEDGSLWLHHLLGPRHTCVRPKRPGAPTLRAPGHRGIPTRALGSGPVAADYWWGQNVPGLPRGFPKRPRSAPLGLGQDGVWGEAVTEPRRHVASTHGLGSLPGTRNIGLPRAPCPGAVTPLAAPDQGLCAAVRQRQLGGELHCGRPPWSRPGRESRGGGLRPGLGTAGHTGASEGRDTARLWGVYWASPSPPPQHRRHGQSHGTAILGRALAGGPPCRGSVRSWTFLGELGAASVRRAARVRVRGS